MADPTAALPMASPAAPAIAPAMASPAAPPEAAPPETEAPEQPTDPAAPEQPSKTAELDIVGTPFRRVDGWAKVTGQTRFADDLTFPRMLHMRLLRSTVPHANVLSIDTSAAERKPGKLNRFHGAGTLRFGSWAASTPFSL